jgi:hypothetical protein
MAIVRKAICDWLCAFLVGTAAAAYCNSTGCSGVLPFLPLAAVPLATFTTTAFHLRFRIVDTLQKLPLDVPEAKGLERLFRTCKKAINYSIFAFITATFVLGSGVLFKDSGHLAGVGVIGIATATFVFSLLKFLRILNVFGALEDFTLKKLVEVAEAAQQGKTNGK